jgi:thioredoxin reductase
MNSPAPLRPNLNLKPSCDVAIIGAGPYGLSLAAHLNARGIQCRIFGKPLSTWSEHMPKDMFLKSDGFASNLSAPSPDSTLKAYCAARNIPYAAQGLPIALDTFLGYANWFRKRHAHQLEELDVVELKQGMEGFDIILEDGRALSAKNVVLAVGISWFKNVPEALALLPKKQVSHAFDHRDGDKFKGHDVIVLGAGSSATDTAVMLHEAGVNVSIVARANAIEYNSIPDPDAETLLYRIQRPASGIGRGWSSYFCATAPVLFHKLPDTLRKRAVQSHMHPAAGWFMREKIEGKIPTVMGREIVSARPRNGQIELELKDRTNQTEIVICDHVIAATGYKTDMRKLPFLSTDLCNSISEGKAVAPLSEKFETRVPGLFVIGPAAIDSFGPLMRFMYGAEFAAPHVAAFLDRRVQEASARQAA